MADDKGTMIGGPPSPPPTNNDADHELTRRPSRINSWRLSPETSVSELMLTEPAHSGGHYLRQSTLSSSSKKGNDELTTGEEVVSAPDASNAKSISVGHGTKESSPKKVQVSKQSPNESPYDDVTDDEETASAGARTVVASAEAAAAADVFTISSNACVESKEKVPRKLPAPVDENIHSTKPSLNVDTSMSSPDKPKYIDSAACQSPATSTIATSPMSSVATVEHRHITKTSRSSSLFLGLRKPVAALVGLYLVGMTGTGIYFLTESLTIPGLQQQIKYLEHQIDRLQTQVDRLEKENDRFEQLNDELEANNAEFAEQNDRLEASNAYYAELNTQLDASNTELERLNGVLNKSNIEYARLNSELSTTTQELNEQVELLEFVNSNLTETLLEYIRLNQGLSNETDRLDRLNNDLFDNLLLLNESLSDLHSENDRLEGLLDDLSTLVSFLNETSLELERSYESIASFLAEQITANRAILSETVHNTYRQRTINWVCGLSLKFATEPFGSDGTVLIGVEAYPEVIEYIEEHVLSELCLDTGDFESFLAAEVGSLSFPPTNTTLNKLIGAVMEFSSVAMDYYFPDAGEAGGLIEADWADAAYRCENLPQEKQFKYSL